MAIDSTFTAVCAASLTGLALSILIERLMSPRPSLLRPWNAWMLHCGLWLSCHGLLTLLLGRPWFAGTAVSAFLLMLVLVNNAKMNALREPFVFQDYEYFTDTIRHPRLYIPFLGWWKFMCCAAGFALAVAIGLWGESAPTPRFVWSGQAGGAALVLGSGMLLLLAGNWKSIPVHFDPNREVPALGLLASLWRYGQEAQHSPEAPSPFKLASSASSASVERPAEDLPHLVAIQSESFFDPRSVCSGIKPDVMAEFDRLKTDGAQHGKLNVPAWGANTVRTEFAFLSGMSEDELGVHRFNPYRAITAGWDVASVASYLKTLGYRSICIHPYPASFYQRDRVYPQLGFDEFIDIRAFDKAQRCGPYIGDTAVGDKISAILQKTKDPVFIFAITMENHGPLHLESVSAADIDDLYATPPPDNCEDLTIYLRHLRNANRMISRLRQTLEQSARPAGLCWFGDHVPVMPSVYEAFGEPDGKVEYVFWDNQGGSEPQSQELSANELSIRWLKANGLISSAG